MWTALSDADLMAHPEVITLVTDAERVLSAREAKSVASVPNV
jgi:hypothetical protein